MRDDREARADCLEKASWIVIRQFAPGTVQPLPLTQNSRVLALFILGALEN